MAKSYHLKTPRTFKKTQTGENPVLEYASATMQGWRKAMEDTSIASIEDKQAFFGIFDGHGGHEIS